MWLWRNGYHPGGGFAEKGVHASIAWGVTPQVNDSGCRRAWQRLPQSVATNTGGAGRMALRTRLSLAFVLIVLIPILVGAIAVLIAVPHILKSQIGTRLRTAGVSVTDVLAARCTQAQ